MLKYGHWMCPYNIWGRTIIVTWYGDPKLETRGVLTVEC